MFKILKAQLDYTKIIFILPVGIVLAAMIANFVLGWPHHEYDLQAVKKLMLFAVVLPFMFNFAFIIKEKRDRVNALLPFPRWKIRLANLSFVIFSWTVLLILYWLASSIARPYVVSLIIWDTLTVTGFVLIANAIVFIYRDMAYMSLSKIQKNFAVFSGIIFIILALIFYLQLGISGNSYKIFAPLLPVKENVIRISATWPAAVISFILGVGMTVLSIFSYKRRIAFLE